MTLDAATRELVENAQRNATKPRHLLSPAEARAMFAGLGKLLDQGPPMARREDFALPANGTELPARLLVPRGAVRGLVVYYHGGGWMVGSNDQFEPMCRQIAERSGCAFLMVCYRKAPENRFPTPMEDAWSAFDWVATHRARFVEEGGRLIVGGDSAGANLAAVVALRERDRGRDRIGGQLLIYPVTDANFARASYADPENQNLLTAEGMITYWNHYAPDTETRRRFEASPLQADDFSGLPPAIVVTAEHDVLRDEGEAYAERLRQAGVAVDLRRFAGQMHGFMMMVGLLPGAAEGARFAGDALRALASR